MPDPLFMYKLQNGLLGAPSNYGGLLADEELQRARNQGLMGFGASLLQSSGPSPVPTGFGQAIGSAMMQGNQAQQQYGESALKSVLLKNQIDQIQRSKKGDLVAVLDEKGKPIYKYAADAVGMSPFSMANPAKDAASIQEYNLYAEQSKAAGKQPISFDQFLRLRTDQTTQSRNTVSNVAEVPTLVTTQGPGAGSQKPLTTLPTEVDATKQKAEAKARAEAKGTATGQATGQAIVDLPRQEANAEQALQTIQKLKSHPGLKYIVGPYSLGPVVPGTPQAGADALAKQVQGKTFLEAFNSLRGSGAITEVEGEKGSQAIARLSRAQNKREYVQALNELENVVHIGLANARKKAGADTAQNNETAAQRAKRLGL